MLKYSKETNYLWFVEEIFKVGLVKLSRVVRKNMGLRVKQNEGKVKIVFVVWTWGPMHITGIFCKSSLHSPLLSLRRSKKGSRISFMIWVKSSGERCAAATISMGCWRLMAARTEGRWYIFRASMQTSFSLWVVATNSSLKWGRTNLPEMWKYILNMKLCSVLDGMWWAGYKPKFPNSTKFRSFAPSSEPEAMYETNVS